jgi:hypothetical protein
MKTYDKKVEILGSAGNFYIFICKCNLKSKKCEWISSKNIFLGVSNDLQFGRSLKADDEN